MGCSEITWRGLFKALAELGRVGVCQHVAPGSSAEDSVSKREQATSFSCAPGPPLCWEHSSATVINMYQMKGVI